MKSFISYKYVLKTRTLQALTQKIKLVVFISWLSSSFLVLVIVLPSTSSSNHPRPHPVLLSLPQSRLAFLITILSSTQSSWIIFPVLVQVLKIETNTGIINISLLISLDRHLRPSIQINRTFRKFKYEIKTDK